MGANQAGAVVIATTTTAGPHAYDVMLMTPDERLKLGKDIWRAVADAIVSFGVEHIYGVELKEWDDGFWSLVLSRRDKRPVMVDLGNMTFTEWLKRERVR